MKNTLFIVDAPNYLFRSYFAIRNMTNSDGIATNALFGFIRSIEKLIKDFGVENIAIAYDGKHNKKQRQKIYPEYKSHREGADDELIHQMTLSKKYLQYRGIHFLEDEYAEADDLIGSVVQWAKNHYDHIYICSSDKDMFQLVTPKISMLFTHKDNLILDSKGVEEKCGVTPEQMIDYLALVGDSSDNIPGVKGFGPKTVASLLKGGRHLTDIIKDPTLIPPGKKRDTFIEEQQNAEISYKLATINTSFPVSHSSSSYTISPIKEEPLYNFYKEMSFSTLARAVKITSAPTTFSPMPLKDKQQLIEKASSPLIIAHTPSSLGIHVNEKSILLTDEELSTLSPHLFASKKIITHNAKQLFHLFHDLKLEWPCVIFDTMLAAYLIDPTKNSYAAAHVLQPFDESITPLPKEEEKYPTYLLQVIQAMTLAYPQLKKQVKPFDHLLSEIDIPLSYVLAKLEITGIHLSKNKLVKQGTIIKEHLLELKKQIHEFAKCSFNINSPKQLGEVLFKQLKLRYPGKKKKTGYETHSDILSELFSDHPIIPLIIEYRNLEKLRSTYIDALPEVIDPKTERIHPTFHQTKTATGRLSCSDPNLQNIPIRTEEGRKIRSAFTPKSGHIFVGADYSQVELRILAHLSQDKQLLEAYKKDEDIHVKTASALFNLPPSKVTKKERTIAKTVNFAVIYGQQAFGLSKELGVSKQEASLWIDAYFKEYPGVKSYIEQTIEKAAKDKGAFNLFGRWRPIADLSSKNSFLRTAAHRLAVNTPIQSLQSDIIKKAMLSIDHELEKQKMHSTCVLQIHDELIFECPENEVEKVKTLIKKIMETTYSLSLPLKVEVYWGKTWEEC